jgi:hypothetical protein
MTKNTKKTASKSTTKAAKAVPPLKRSKGKTMPLKAASAGEVAQPSAPATKTRTTAAKTNVDKVRDPRLPKVGTILRKEWRGREYEVTVLADGFEYAGTTYRSLSKVANEITGTTWNGFLWMGLVERAKPAPKPAEPASQALAAPETHLATSPAVQP